MAKVKAPLMSFSARGKIADALVYFPWKGVNAVRQYVIPANPQSDDQTTQRTRMEDAVDEWHGAAYTADDVTAWNRLAGIAEKIMSGFNRMVQEHILENILGNTWTRIWAAWFSAIITTSLTVNIAKVSAGDVPTVYWGTRKTHFPNSKAMTDLANDRWFADISGLIKNTLYYFYFDVGTSGSSYGRTGIYQQRTAAA